MYLGEKKRTLPVHKLGRFFLTVLFGYLSTEKMYKHIFINNVSKCKQFYARLYLQMYIIQYTYRYIYI